MKNSGADRNSISPPSGTGKVSGMGEAFSLDLNSGQGNYSVAFEVPDGVAGLKPNIKLEYMHGNANGPFGLGWLLQMRKIERRLDLGAPGEDAEERFLDSGQEMCQSADGSFHLLRESAFSIYERIDDHWVVTEKNGTRFFFGEDATARIANPDHQERIQTWMLQRQEDVHGNRIDYEYADIEGYNYLSTIQYAKYIVRYEYESRDDIVTNGHAGFARQITQRCKAINLHLEENNQKIRSLNLTYDNTAISEISLLASTQLIAHGDGQADVVKNPSTFTYSEFDPQNFNINWVDSQYGDPEPPPLSDPDTALIAMDNLPLPGILANRSGKQYYWPNDGDGAWGFPRLQTNSPAVSSFEDDGVQFLDMNATGSADMLVGVGSNQLNGYYQNQGAEGLGNFVGYPRQARVLPPFYSGRVRLGDLDGNGFIDSLYTTQRGLVSFRNYGEEGWVEPTISPNTPQVDFADPLTFMADMTGDGMSDIVRVRSGKIEYWLNLGNGRFGEPVVMRNSPRLPGISRHAEQVILIDAEGGGCSDLLLISSDGISLYINKSGQSFANPIRIASLPIPIPGTARAVDMKGRGHAGILYNSLQSGKVGYVYFQWNRDIPPANLIQSIDNGAGLVSSIEYTSLTEMALNDRNDGRPWGTHMPFPLWLVSKTIETDSVSGRESEVQYRYHDGHFDPLSRRFQGFGHVEKQEIGDESRADVLTKYTFLINQGEQPNNSREHASLDRLLSHLEVFSLDGSVYEEIPYHIEESDYDFDILEVLDNGDIRTFVFVKATRKRYRERTNDERVEERIFDYDAFGNVIREEVVGRGILNGAPVNENQVVSDISYATNLEQSIWQMSAVVKRDVNGNIISELRRLYDGNDFSGLAIGQLSRGLLVREEHLVLPLAQYQTLYADMAMAPLGYFQQSDADGVQSVFALEKQLTYTAQGNIKTQESGTGQSTEKLYDNDGLFVIEETSNGKTSHRVNEPISGKPLKLTSHNGSAVRMQYDAFGRITAFIIEGESDTNATRLISYDDTQVPNSMRVSYRINSTQRSESVTFYNGSSKEIQKRVERQAGEVIVSGWSEVNPWAQVKAEFEPTIDFSMNYSMPDLTEKPARLTFFDGEGRPVQTQNYNNGIGSVIFKPFELAINDAIDNNPASPHVGTSRLEQVDVWNNRTAVIETGNGGTQHTTRYDIGLFGELRELSDSSGVICTHSYDLRGNRLQIQHRDAGNRQQWFNSRNEIVRSTDAVGNDVAVTRDPEGRVTEVENNGDIVEVFVYDDVGVSTDGRLVDTQYDNGSQQFEYNQRGQLSTHTITVDSQTFELRYQYNDMGRQTRITYPDGSTIDREYYNNGMVRRIPNIIDNIIYDARNLPIEVQYANGVETQIVYEPGVGHIKSQSTVGPSGVVLEDTEYAYDALMQLISASDNSPGAQQTVDYTYDALNQLQQAKGSDVNGSYTTDYDYSNGYNLAKNGESDWQMGYGDPLRADRLTDISRPGEAVFNVAYDNNGNVGALPGKTMQYNFKNQLTSVVLDNGTTVQYDYDYRGNKVRRRTTQGGVTTESIYLGRLVEFRGGQFTNFVILDRKRIAVLNNGKTRWVHLDSQGSANYFSDEAGLKISQIAYHPYGNVRRRTGHLILSTFALHDYDGDTGLIYMGHRWYSPEIGRFITPDPLYLYQPDRSEGDPVQLRLYTYVGNDPMNHIDPMGLSFWSVFGAIVGVIVGVLLAVAVVAAFATGIGFGLLIVAGIIALITVSYVVANANQGNAWGEFFRGFMIGINAGMSATFLAMMGPVGVFLGGFVGTVIFLSSVDSIAGNDVYQSILGWSNWISPMSWLVTGLGLVMWILNGLGHLILWEIPNLWGGGIGFFRITGFRMDWSTGMLATRGGWASNLNPIDTAFNMGNFAYVDTNSVGWHLDHEAGHNLNLGAYGSIFHFIGFIHEMGTSAGANAFSEQLAEGNVSGTTGAAHPMWN